MKKFAAIVLAILMTVSITACKSGGVDSDLLGKYSYCGEDESFTSTVVLNENGTFEFTFSEISDYIGHGKYTIKNDVLTLKTDDGKYHYTFKMEDGTLIFDAENSSEEIWFGDFSDGSVFE